MKVAFIGLGNMGSHMARHLLRAGHDVTLWNRTLSKAEELRSQGARSRSRRAKPRKRRKPSSPCWRTTLRSSRRCFIPAACWRACRQDAAHISMSTISVALSRKLAEEHAKRGHKYIAAPVFGQAGGGGSRQVVHRGRRVTRTRWSATGRCWRRLASGCLSWATSRRWPTW